MPKKKNPDYWLAKGGEHWKKGEFQKAIDSATEAIRLDPKLAGAYNNRGL
jgi:tetratricopeptide (TPR) repeat protein